MGCRSEGWGTRREERLSSLDHRKGLREVPSRWGRVARGSPFKLILLVQANTCPSDKEYPEVQKTMAWSLSKGKRYRPIDRQKKAKGPPRKSAQPHFWRPRHLERGSEFGRWGWTKNTPLPGSRVHAYLYAALGSIVRTWALWGGKASFK